MSAARQPLYADCVFALPLKRSFQYRIPEPLRGRLRPGARVLVPFGPRRLTGFVTAVSSTAQIKAGRYKEILTLIDPEPLATPEQLELAPFLADYYCCTLGEALSAVVPQALRVPSAGSADTAESSDAVPITLPAGQALPRVLQQALARRQHRIVAVLPSLGASADELCLQAIAQTLSAGRTVLLLAPEISQLCAWHERLQGLGIRCIMWHSALSAKQRARAWQEMRAEGPHLILGTRSAALVPLQRLGLVVIDQEHDTAYKQPEVPRYHARTVAVERARRQRAAVILASPTLSLETYQAARLRRYTLVRVPAPPGFRPPTVTIVDRRSLRGSKRYPAALVSPTLELALRAAMARQRPSLLFLNRRGFATQITCQSCGAVMRCPDCDVALTYHFSRRELVCHYCNAHQQAPEHCPACRKGYLRYRGSGTEKVESELYRLFPEIPTTRLDADARPQDAAAAPAPEAARLVVGTQLITRQLPLHSMQVVGVVSADTALHLPDFRAGERLFALLMRLAAQAQSGAEGGQMVVQTSMPLHPVMQSFRALDYRRFASEELRHRRRLSLPPYRQLIELSLRARGREPAERFAQQLAAQLHRAAPRATVWGPAPALPARARGWYQWRVFLKGRDPAALRQAARRAAGAHRRVDGASVIVDVDP